MGVRVNYLKVGGTAPALSDDALIFIHGMASSLAFWNLGVTQSFADAHKVVLVDLRGHGRSAVPETGYRPAIMASDVLGLMDSLSISSAHVVAHSFGGAVALHLSRIAPDRVSTLTLADTRLRGIQPKIDFKNWVIWPQYRDCLETIGVRDWESSGELGAKMFTIMAQARLKNPEQFEKMNQLLPSPFGGMGGNVAAKRWLNLVEKTSFLKEYEEGEDLSEATLASITTPTLLLYGEFSQSLPTASALMKLLPKARFEMVEKAGHFFPVTKPTALIDAIHGFLAATRSRESLAVH